MTRLTQGMYGDNEFDRKSALFGLHSGQRHFSGISKLTHNSGWYNKAGEKLGWGDLSTTDAANIACGLEDDALFIVLSESDDRGGGRGTRAEPPPGVDHVAARAIYIIASGIVYQVNKSTSPRKEPTFRDGLTIHELSRAEAKRLIKTGQTDSVAKRLFKKLMG